MVIGLHESFMLFRVLCSTVVLVYEVLLDLMTLDFVWRHHKPTQFERNISNLFNKIIQQVSGEGFEDVNTEFVLDMMAVVLLVIADVSQYTAAAIILKT